MELKEVIEKRRTVRDFKDKKVPQEIIKYAIENGFKAPTNNHLREWDFIIINSLESKLKLIESEKLDKAINIDELRNVYKNEEVTMKEMYLDAIPKQKKMIINASSLIIVLYKPQISVEKAKRIYDLTCLASIWTCIENFLLSIAEHDVYGVTFIPQNIDTIKDKLGIPTELEIAAIIPIGYRDEQTRPLKQKTINISERIHKENW